MPGQMLKITLENKVRVGSMDQKRTLSCHHRCERWKHSQTFQERGKYHEHSPAEADSGIRSKAGGL